MKRWTAEDITRVKLLDKIAGGNSMICACGSDMDPKSNVTVCSVCWTALTEEEIREVQQNIFRKRWNNYEL